MEGLLFGIKFQKRPETLPVAEQTVVSENNFSQGTKAAFLANAQLAENESTLFF